MVDLAPQPAEAASTFGELLRGYRAAAGLTQEALASRSGLSPRGIGDLECGRRSWPRNETVRLLVAGLGLTGADRAAFFRAAQRPSIPRRAGAGEAAVGRPTAPLPVPFGDTAALPFVGRAEELALLGRLLRDRQPRLVTLTGVGGCGKTRLALESARQVATAFPDGVCFVDLAPVANPALLLPAIASALDLHEIGGQPIESALIARLHDQRVLLLLDNCEQLLPIGPELGTILAACPGLTILATSRGRLNLRVEQEVLVPPLPLPDPTADLSLADLQANPAITLFLHRAAKSQLSFALTAENATVIAAICQRLDGLPLAIELAAAQVKVLPPAALLARLERRLPLLMRGPADAPARQRTLWDALAWSYDLLTSEEQALFRRLAVFVGGWTLEAVEAVVGTAGGQDVLDALGSLIDQSLVRMHEHGAEVRYDTFETVREFALAQFVQDDKRDAVLARHADYFLAFAEREAVAVDGVMQQQQLARLELEHPNLRQAFTTLENRGDDDGYARLANALCHFWGALSYAREGLLRLERVLERQTGRTVTRARALIGAGHLADGCGDYDQAARWLREGEALARSLGERALLTWSLLDQGSLAEQLGDDARAQAFFEAGYALVRDSGTFWIGDFATFLSAAAYRRGELAQAEQYAREAMASHRLSGEAFMASLNLGNVAQVALARGAIPNAAAACEDALALALAVEFPCDFLTADAIAGAAAISAAIGRDEAAARLLGAAEAERARSAHLRLPHFCLFDQTKNAVRDKLDDVTFDAEWAVGQALSEAAAVASATAVLADARDGRGMSRWRDARDAPDPQSRRVS
jgi:predicted ATPase/DNA-binding XRE family transcriptional regulator